ncbi:hypothetical protein [Methylobacterium sp. 391_Methyba4]|uniref:hypothetical protein n=1 Tax=Methylobacterium sp. 391_Methyba4 TaxID=3038924 RepID=UPI00241C443B|nr:hypothetical protein [Methylobacterium sp. 391_Methyba4]WFS07191.1 hypothetical protein P9K36_28150 [Methylobacterium sp. 391_Methyba4]
MNAPTHRRQDDRAVRRRVAAIGNAGTEQAVAGEGDKSRRRSREQDGCRCCESRARAVVRCEPRGGVSRDGELGIRSRRIHLRLRPDPASGGLWAMSDLRPDLRPRIGAEPVRLPASLSGVCGQDFCAVGRRMERVHPGISFALLLGVVNRSKFACKVSRLKIDVSDK